MDTDLHADISHDKETPRDYTVLKSHADDYRKQHWVGRCSKDISRQPGPIYLLEAKVFSQFAGRSWSVGRRLFCDGNRIVDVFLSTPVECLQSDFVSHYPVKVFIQGALQDFVHTEGEHESDQT